MFVVFVHVHKKKLVIRSIDFNTPISRLSVVRLAFTTQTFRTFKPNFAKLRLFSVAINAHNELNTSTGQRKPRFHEFKKEEMARIKVGSLFHINHGADLIEIIMIDKKIPKITLHNGNGAAEMANSNSFKFQVEFHNDYYFCDLRQK